MMCGEMEGEAGERTPEAGIGASSRSVVRVPDMLRLSSGQEEVSGAI
jgi:hypothetical protein